MASAMPVFPLVASIRVSPRWLSPRFSASTIIDKAGRSLTEPAGLLPSSLASITLLAFPTRCRSCTSGVLPTVSSMVLYMGEGLTRDETRGTACHFTRDQKEAPLQTRGSTMLLRACGGPAATRPDLLLGLFVLVCRFHCRIALGCVFGSGFVRLGVLHRRILGCFCILLRLGCGGFGILLHLGFGSFGIFLGFGCGIGVRLGFGLGRLVGLGLLGLHRLG